MQQIISKCNEAGKPVIVATQMLESMVKNPRPTRAEANDVANAIIDGADAVMLSEETATGAYPIESVTAMSSISQVTESRAILKKDSFTLTEGRPIADIIGSLAAQAVTAVKPSAIFVVTRSGFSSLMVSKHRPKVPILAITKDEKVVRKMHLYWGVKPLDVEWSEDRDQIISARHWMPRRELQHSNPPKVDLFGCPFWIQRDRARGCWDRRMATPPVHSASGGRSMRQARACTLASIYRRAAELRS